MRRGREQCFRRELRRRSVNREIEESSRLIAEQKALDPGDDCTDAEFSAHFRRLGELMDRNFQLLKTANVERVAWFASRPPRGLAANPSVAAACAPSRLAYTCR